MLIFQGIKTNNDQTDRNLALGSGSSGRYTLAETNLSFLNNGLELRDM